jgi:transposase
MHDNAPCHTSRLVKEFLAQESIQVLKWPPQSPDLNPIENLWGVMKRELWSEFPTTNTRAQLVANVTTIWNPISVELCENLANSPKKRIEMALKRNGRQLPR